VAGRDDDIRAATFHVGRPGGNLTEIVADELVFAGDEDILLLEPAGDGVELRQVRAGAVHEVLWRVRVPDVVRDSLQVRSADRRWRVMGWDSRRRHVVRAEGLIGEPGFQRTEWAAEEEVEGFSHSLAASGSDAVFVENRYRIGLLPRQWHWTWWLFPPEGEAWFRAASGGVVIDLATSPMDARCHPAALSADALLCGAFDGTRTRFISMDPASKRIHGVAWLDGQFFPTCESAGGWLCGWLNGSPVALNPERRQAFRIADSRRMRAFEIAGTDRVLATLGFDGTGSIVRLYSME
jgi:hypothetical protein